MAKQVQLRRGNTIQHSSFTGVVGELTVDTDLDTIKLHDGTLAGGHRMARYSDLTTSNVTEGTGLYFTNTRVQNYLTGSVGNIIPSQNNYYDLGSSAFRWKDLYLSGNTLYIGGATISATGATITLPAGTSIGGAPLATTENITTSNVAEGANLYYTNARARAAISVSGSGTYDSSTGVINITGGGGGGGGSNVISESASSITENYTLTTNRNGMSVGTINIAANIVVTIPTNQLWQILG